MRESANRIYHERRAQEAIELAEAAMRAEEEHKKQKTKQNQGPMYGKKSDGKTLAELNIEARKRGMTYGQYMEYLYFH